MPRFKMNQDMTYNLSVDLICEGRDGEDDEPIITAICEKPIQIEIRYGNKSKTICATERK